MAALLTSGCVSADTPAGHLDDASDVMLVERSKATSPSWVSLTPGKLIDTPVDHRIVTARSKLLNLPLGLKQTQMAAVDALRAAVGTWAKAHLLAVAAVANVPAPAQPAALDRLVSAAVADVAGRYGKVSDIYFERLENHALVPGDPMASYYAAYVLAAFPKDRDGALFAALAKRLQAAGDPALRRLAVPCQGLSRGDTPG